MNDGAQWFEDGYGMLINSNNLLYIEVVRTHQRSHSHARERYEVRGALIDGTVLTLFSGSEDECEGFKRALGHRLARLDMKGFHL